MPTELSGIPPGIQYRDFYNMLDYATYPWISPTTALANAMAAAASQGGGHVLIPEGNWVLNNLSLYNNIHVWGAGIGATILTLANGANTDLFSAYTSNINLSASTGSGSTTGANFWGFHNLTIDGNRANQTSGPSYPIRAYGYGHVLEHVEIRNGYSGGLLLDWNGGANPTPPNDAFMPFWYSVMVHDCNGILIQIGGPTDMQWIAVNGFAGGSHCVHIAPNCIALRQLHSHFWATPTGKNAVTMLIEANEPVLTSCQIEGSDTCALVVLGSDFSATALELGSTADASRVGRGLQLGQQAGNTPYASQIYQSGGVTTAQASNVNHISGKAFACNAGVLDEQNTSGNVYDILAYQTSGTAIASNSGYPSANSSGRLKVNGLTQDGKPGTGGFFQIGNGSFYGMRVYNKNGSPLFNIDTYSSLIQLLNGNAISGYSDNGTTLTLKLNASDGSLLLGNASSMRAGSGVPSNSLGVNGDYYFRSDTPGTANQRIYVKSSGAWVGIV